MKYEQNMNKEGKKKHQALIASGYLLKILKIWLLLLFISFMPFLLLLLFFYNLRRITILA